MAKTIGLRSSEERVGNRDGKGIQKTKKEKRREARLTAGAEAKEKGKKGLMTQSESKPLSEKHDIERQTESKGKEPFQLDCRIRKIKAKARERGYVGGVEPPRRGKNTTFRGW